MLTTVKIRKKGQVTIPTRMRTWAGIANGDVIEAPTDRDAAASLFGYQI
jgi:bifunctional DNA-binding transcriptional regulator/antitoxin component of YhaV-PrlF toxin-antitoxin module